MTLKTDNMVCYIKARSFTEEFLKTKSNGLGSEITYKWKLFRTKLLTQSNQKFSPMKYWKRKQVKIKHSMSNTSHINEQFKSVLEASISQRTSFTFLKCSNWALRHCSWLSALLGELCSHKNSYHSNQSMIQFLSLQETRENWLCIWAWALLPSIMRESRLSSKTSLNIWSLRHKKTLFCKTLPNKV